MASGLVLLDKPAGITSHDLVARLRKQLGTKKIGHAGTLDPMATGLMLLGVNGGTKLMQFLSGLDKTYLGRIVLGVRTATDDREGEVLSRADASRITEAQIEAGLARLRGDIDQVPASVSAISIDGKRAYERVRAGESVELPARRVRIDRFERTGEIERGDSEISFPVRVDCSSGTYIRSLARDLGEQLGVGGHLGQLRRTRIGPFDIAEAAADLEQARIISLAEAARKVMPVLEVSSQQAKDLFHGRRVIDAANTPTACVYQGDLVAIVAEDGKILVGFPGEIDA